MDLFTRLDGNYSPIAKGIGGHGNRPGLTFQGNRVRRRPSSGQSGQEGYVRISHQSACYVQLSWADEWSPPIIILLSYSSIWCATLFLVV